MSGAMQATSDVVENIGGLGTKPQATFLGSRPFDFRETPYVNIMIRPLSTETEYDLNDISMTTSINFVTFFDKYRVTILRT